MTAAKTSCAPKQVMAGFALNMDYLVAATAQSAAA